MRRICPDSLGGKRIENKICMKQNILSEMVNNNLSTYKIASLLGCSQTNVRHWLKKYGLRTSKCISNYPINGSVNCVLCKKSILVKLRNKRMCSACRTRIRRFRTKWAAVKYLGGKCVQCGWEGRADEIAAYDFHHRESDKKEFQIGNVANKSWESIKEELGKCDLVCRRCHSILHSKHNDALLLEEAKKYNGRLLPFNLRDSNGSEALGVMCACPKNRSGWVQLPDEPPI